MALDQHLAVISSEEKHNVSLTSEGAAHAENDCVAIEYVAHFGAERPSDDMRQSRMDLIVCMVNPCAYESIK